jgi:hypothetical protein
MGWEGKEWTNGKRHVYIINAPIAGVVRSCLMQIKSFGDELFIYISPHILLQTAVDTTASQTLP